jgi:uncharacterized protein YlzI (FlbEa/FlbD family)
MIFIAIETANGKKYINVHNVLYFEEYKAVPGGKKELNTKITLIDGESILSKDTIGQINAKIAEQIIIRG